MRLLRVDGLFRVGLPILDLPLSGRERDE